MGCNAGPILKAVTRKKPLEDNSSQESKLDRVLTVFDLTALGVGSTLGKDVRTSFIRLTAPPF